MDFEAIQTFLAVHQTGGFSVAAARLRRSQPAISRRIALLEDELGAPLFERTSQGVVLSQAGEVLLPFAEKAVAALEDCEGAIAGLSNGTGGPVSLVAVGTLADIALTRVLKDFRRAYPAVALTLRTATSAQVSDLVRRGEVTIGLRYFDDRAADLTCEWVFDERLGVVCAPDHRLANDCVSSLADLKQEHWFAFPAAGDPAEAASGNIFAQFLIRDVPAIDWTQVDSLTAQKRLVEAGYGLALMPQSAVADEVDRGALAWVEVDDLAVTQPVYVVVRTQGYLSPASTALMQFLKDQPNAN